MATLEYHVQAKEAQIKLFPTPGNREELNRVNVELKKCYLYEEEFCKQKLGMKWFGEGDRNTKFFHSYVNGRKKSYIFKKFKLLRGIDQLE